MAKPGFSMPALEILGSLLTHDERCASLPLVVQSAPPRPWPFPRVAQNRAQHEEMTTGAFPVLIAASSFPEVEIIYQSGFRRATEILTKANCCMGLKRIRRLRAGL